MQFYLNIFHPSYLSKSYGLIRLSKTWQKYEVKKAKSSLALKFKFQLILVNKYNSSQSTHCIQNRQTLWWTFTLEKWWRRYGKPHSYRAGQNLWCIIIIHIRFLHRQTLWWTFTLGKWWRPYRKPHSYRVDRSPWFTPHCQGESACWCPSHRMRFVCLCVRSLQKATLIPGGSESLVYTTLSGGIGMLVPVTSHEVCMSVVYYYQSLLK